MYERFSVIGILNNMELKICRTYIFRIWVIPNMKQLERMFLQQVQYEFCHFKKKNEKSLQ